MAWRAVDAHNRGVEAQNGALEDLKTSGRRFPSLWWGAGFGSALRWKAWSGSALKCKAGSGSAFKWCGAATVLENKKWPVVLYLMCDTIILNFLQALYVVNAHLCKIVGTIYVRQVTYPILFSSGIPVVILKTTEEPADFENIFSFCKSNVKQSSWSMKVRTKRNNVASYQIIKARFLAQLDYITS